jgi:hypothetical protein
MRPGPRQELLRSDNRSAIAQIMLQPELSLEDQAAVARRELEARQAELGTLANRDRDNDSFANDPAASAILAFVRQNAERPVEVFERLATEADERHLRFIVDQLDEDGTLDRIFERIDEGATLDRLFGGPAGPSTAGESFVQVARLRPAWKNIRLAERRLSSGIFDSVSPAEARFAYHLVRLLPADAQDRFVRQDGGDWFRRLEEHLGEDMFQGGSNRPAEYQGIEIRRRNGALVNVAGEYTARLAEDQSHSFDAIMALARPGIDQRIATQIFQRLASVEVEVPSSAPDGRPTLLEALVRRLDQRGVIAQTFDALGDIQLLAGSYREVTLRIMLARDPAHVVIHARRLLDEGWFNSVTPREAYLAYQLLRTLPDDERTRFVEQEPELWSRVVSNLTTQMRASSDLNVFSEREGLQARRRIMAQLQRPGLWTAANVDQLRGLINMAIALGQGRAVFELSRQRAAYNNSALQPLVERLARYNPQRRVYKEPS